MTTAFWHLLTVLSLLLGGLAVAQEPQNGPGNPATIGNITFVAGSAHLERNGVTVAAVKGQSLQVGDRVRTGSDGHVHARMIDNAFVSVRPAARLHIQAYVYDPQNPTANRVGFMLESGVVRTISGKAGEANRQSYRFNTPIAAIGLRGTDYVVQALPEVTRVSVLRGAIVLSPFGPGCQSDSLAPCTGPQVRELLASNPHAYIEVMRGGLPVIVKPDDARDTPDKASPARPEEPTGSAAALSPRTPAGLTPAQIQQQAQAQAAAQEAATKLAQRLSLPPEIVWGRWSGIALPDVPSITTVMTPARETTLGNAYMGLLRPAGTRLVPGGGVIAMTYLDGTAYLKTATPGAPDQFTPAALRNGTLTLDFNQRQFATRIDVVSGAQTNALNAQGRIQFQGLLYVDPQRSNMNLAGTLSDNANEAGYLFDAKLAAGQTLLGATRWGR